MLEALDAASKQRPHPPVFACAVCVADATVAGQAARRQAKALTARGGTVTSVPAPRGAWRDPEAVLRLADRADVLVLAAGATSDAIVTHTTVPVLFSRWLPFDEDIAERILVAVDQWVDPSRAAEISGMLAAAGNGTVAIAPVLARYTGLRRASNRSRRIVLETTGCWPDLVGEEVARGPELAAAVQRFDASLLVLPLGGTRESTEQAVQALHHVACPVLAIPSSTLRPRA
jgi:hypothetical protein